MMIYMYYVCISETSYPSFMYMRKEVFSVCVSLSLFQIVFRRPKSNTAHNLPVNIRAPPIFMRYPLAQRMCEFL